MSDSTSTFAVARRYVDALTAKDFAAVASLFADGIAWHQPGANRFSGTRHGAAAVTEMLGGQMAVTNGTLDVQVTGAPMVNGATFALPVHFTAKREGAQISMDGVDILRVDGDKIAEVWLFSADQHGEDAFWDAG